jgi:hypothetical protein
MDSVHRTVDHVGPWSTVDPRTQARRQLAGAMLAGRCGSSVLTAGS